MINNTKQKEFLEAYLPFQNNLWRYCLFMTKNRDAAKDLLGETVAVAYQGFNDIREQKAFLSWLFTVASRLFYKMKRKSDKISNDGSDSDQLFSTDLSPDILSDISFLYENLNRLPVEQKETIILFSIEGFSRSEIADMQNVSEETVKSRLARGRRKLAILMGAENE
jgi:RNA polymerase sigma-70 factor, ECF subfamily